MVNSDLAPVSVLIVEDHALVAEMLTNLLLEARFEVHGVAANAGQARALYNRYRPDLVLCDVRLGDGADGVELTRQLRSDFPDALVVMVSAENDGNLVQRAYAAGAAGYVSKFASGDELVQTIRDALAGITGGADRHTYRRLVAQLQQHGSTTPAPGPRLTPREREVVELLVAGVTSSAQLAAELGITVHSVRTHIENCRRKFGVTSRAQIVAKAYQYQLVPVDHQG